ncbi:cobaltochelatase subunit CobN [Caulobacter sp. 3R27C2-B]|mgnify:CR=1 FL=1|uniref:cobaltochelatase subunit CobN n=1 Tax=Caulobacter sp. 3R27C2-B TaxID=2502219 RepID=UPI0010F63588|nr:cobaltochelatase subunit CobN [Caulobacter sp. 3R27C2-B]
MHLLVRETRSLDETEIAEDLGQSPADLVVLSFSDADLTALAAAWALPRPGQLGHEPPSLRLANLARLRHPMSVDLYVEQVIVRAKAVAVRLIGGLDYWRYGCEELSAACRANGIPLALLPGDARPDPRLTALSTLPAAWLETLDLYLREGGPQNAAGALQLLASAAGLAEPPAALPVRLSDCGEHALAGVVSAPSPLAVIVFYRSHLMSGDTAPVEAVAQALAARGLGVRALYVTSLKAPGPAAFVTDALTRWRPAVVLNATGFSARADDGRGSPLDAADAPVLQLILSGAAQADWAASARGLGPADLAMQVVLPELDGRLATTAISFKADCEAAPELEFVGKAHRPDPAQVALAADRAAGWARLSATPTSARRVAVVLSDYPGAVGQIGHAVGLDTFASLEAIEALLRDAGYDCGAMDEAAGRALRERRAEPVLMLDRYAELFAELPPALQAQVCDAWGEPGADPAVVDGAFVLPLQRRGRLLVAVQPNRAPPDQHKAAYHDADLPPRHAYVAFYLWLRREMGVHAIVHLGAHGSLEWLPGKAAAPSADDFPAALSGGTPVIYPFIVNNPGEAAPAKRRLGAVLIGHLTPALKSARAHGAAFELERLIDEYAAADGLDRRRGALLRREILDRAEACGVLAESGTDARISDEEALARLDAYLCDVKDLQIRDGLHVFGQPPSPERREALLEALQRSTPGTAEAELGRKLDACAGAEREALLAALDGRFVPPGPAGAPTRGRADVLPTGRNLYAVDPRAVPTRSAMVLAEKAAEELLRRHLQDHGDWPRSLMLDLWGSATMRTGGEDLALAFILMGAKPVWDHESARVSGVEILPLAVLDRPRVDVTLRVSGLFRDAFEAQMLLFDSAVQVIAARDEPAEWNGLAAQVEGLSGPALRAATTRIYGAAPGGYGAGVGGLLQAGGVADRAELAAAYLAASGHAYGQGLSGGADPAGFAARVAGAEAFVHTQDHAEIDLLDGDDFATHEGGFAAAADSLGARPALYHADTSRPDAPKVRTVKEEIARVVRGRLANPAWIGGMMRHGYRGAAEIAKGVDGLFGFAATLPERIDAQFELAFDATLADPEVDAFLRAENPEARTAMAERFRQALARDLWRPRRNSVGAILEATPMERPS